MKKYLALILTSASLMSLFIHTQVIASSGGDRNPKPQTDLPSCNSRYCRT